MSISTFVILLVALLLFLMKIGANAGCRSVEYNHSRSKRYLLFDKGASLTIAGSAVKTLVSGIPQGLNLILEETIYYELPHSVFVPKPNPNRTTLRKPMAFKNQFKPEAYLEHAPSPGKYLYSHPSYIMHKRDVDSTDENNMDIWNKMEQFEDLLFQMLTYFARKYRFKERYCIMRTICEAQFFLFSKGVSVFHDIIRILLEYSMPVIRRNEKYLRASQVDNPLDCANLYGPHCRISFLLYFTDQIHGKQIRWERKEVWSPYNEGLEESNFV